MSARQSLADRKTAPDIHNFVQMLNSDITLLQLEGVRGIRRVLCNDQDSRIREVTASGVVPKLIEFMMWDNYPQIQLESAWTITNICSGQSDDVKYVVDCEGIELTVKLLESDFAEIIDQNIWTIGNIAGDSDSYKDRYIKADVINKLAKVVYTFHDRPVIQKNTIWAMTNILRKSPLPQWDDISVSIPIIMAVVAAPLDDELLIDVLRSLHYISGILFNGTIINSSTVEQYIERVIDMGCVPFLIAYITHTNMTVKLAAISVLGHITRGTEDQKHIVLKNAEFIPNLFRSASDLDPDHCIRRQICRMLRTITTDAPDQIAKIIDNTLYMDILRALFNDQEELTWIEVAWTLCNIGRHASAKQMRKIVEEYDCLDIIKAALKSLIKPIIRLGLQTIDNMLKSEYSDIYMEKFKINCMLKEIRVLRKSQHQELVEKILSYLSPKKGEKSKEMDLEDLYDKKITNAEDVFDDRSGIEWDEEVEVVIEYHSSDEDDKSNMKELDKSR